jgi:hypothetical protein
VRDRVGCLRVDPVPLKGKSRPLELFKIPTPGS